MALQDLLKDAGLSEDEIKQTMEAFNPKAVDAIDKATLRQSDYSRNMDSLKREREELEARWQLANTEYQRMMTDLDSSQRERDAATKKLEEAEAKLKEAATAPIIDPTKFMSPDQVKSLLDERSQELANGSTAYFGEVLDIMDEHRRLFGDSLSAKDIIQKARAEKKLPRDYWEEAYKVGEKRSELAQKSEEEMRNKYRAEGREAAIQELSKPPEARGLTDSKSPFFTPSEENSSPWDNVGPSDEEKQLLTELTRFGR